MQDRKISAPIENEVEVMSDYGLRYAALINPRYYGWDNSYISYSLQKYPDRFVAHGLDQPGRSESGGAAALLDKRAWLSGHALQPLVPSELEVAQFESALSAVA
jgi:hypothetical protein